MTRAVQFDPATQNGPVPSPCISVCEMDRTSGLCIGCLRTLDEIADWGLSEDDRKRAIWRMILQRREATET